ncbi:uncharacterized protein LOC125853412 [Solanum stenotomum]|uniref:uncharacterized protein LOC125853412 n=1 Tax=Solanum stenotomum TaxID=172797 RepID=UPI0020D1C7B3|nr:uncharacterized protein LOC125853412 [Solanum stenotomum]
MTFCSRWVEGSMYPSSGPSGGESLRKATHTVGRASRATTNEGADQGYIFLAMHTGRYRVLCVNLSCVPTRQGGAKHPRGILEPLPVSEHPWENVTMDFITSLPKSDGYRTIIVVVDKFSKYAAFIPAIAGCTTNEAARLFFKNVVKYWGLLRHIISDRDPRFTGNFWRELFEILGKSLGAYHLAKGWEEQLDTAKSYLDKETNKMKKFADRGRRPTDYKEGDMVLVKFNPRQFKALRGVHQNLVRKYDGPFRIVANVGKISYKVEFPPHFKIHSVFHANILKPYHEDKEDTSRNQSRRAPITVTASYDREIEAIIDYQAKQKQGQQASAMFLVHWKGQSPDEATYEKYEDLWQFKDQVLEFMQQCAAVVASLGGGACDVPPF